MYIQWKKSLELNNDLIDTQHRIEVFLCRKLDIAIKSRRPDQIVRWQMRELRLFTEFHFISEENFMNEIGYPGARVHAMIHTDLLMQLDMMLAKIAHHREFPEDMLYFLNKWLAQHIVKEDLKIVSYHGGTERKPIGGHLYHEYLAV
jgi:hemerythrin-like metal-binding protein